MWKPSPVVLSRGAIHAGGSYRCPHVSIVARHPRVLRWNRRRVRWYVGRRGVARGRTRTIAPGVTRRLIGAFAAGQAAAFPPGSSTDRILATVMFSDMVSSTERAAEIGDRRWREVLDRHDELVRKALDAHGGREINTTGDGFVGAFR